MINGIEVLAWMGTWPGWRRTGNSIRLFNINLSGASFFLAPTRMPSCSAFTHLTLVQTSAFAGGINSYVYLVVSGLVEDDRVDRLKSTLIPFMFHLPGLLSINQD